MKRFHSNGSDHPMRLRINIFYRSVLDPVPNKTHNNPKVGQQLKNQFQKPSPKPTPKPCSVPLLGSFILQT